MGHLLACIAAEGVGLAKMLGGNNEIVAPGEGGLIHVEVLHRGDECTKESRRRVTSQRSTLTHKLADLDPIITFPPVFPRMESPVVWPS